MVDDEPMALVLSKRILSEAGFDDRDRSIGL